MKTLLVAILFGALVGCTPAVQYVIPPMGEDAVPQLTLADRPTLDLTDQEIIAIYKASPTGTSKILKNQARWKGFADIADALREGYKGFITKVFGGKVKDEPKSPTKK
jgi:hypothetical protein